MKKNLLFLAFAICSIQIASAKIWRINNTGVPADFTTAQTAHDNASVLNGDTLHFEASGTNYGALSLQKRLVIIGNGYFLGTSASNSNQDLQANPAPSSITELYVFSGGSNSVVMGMTFSTVYMGYGSLVNNFLFRRNRILGNLNFYSSGSNNVQILQCFLDGGIGQSSSHTNVFIGNCIITTGVNFDSDDNGTFQNNVFHTGGAYSSGFTNFVLRSNILISGSITQTTCVSEFNLGNSTQFGTSNGNQSNIVMSTVFLGYPTIGTNSSDGRYQLQNLSPALGAGYGSVDCGAYGNTTPYVKSGMPDVPSIYKLSVPPVVTNNVLSVIVSTKTNQ